MGATYAIAIARRGHIGFLTTTSLPSLATPDGARAVVGNNPLAFAVPRKPPERPLVLDMALSIAALGRIRLAARSGDSIPSGWARDRSGQPTTDAQEALASRLLEPIGGYKGYGLAVIGEVLAGALTGSLFGAHADAHGAGVGHFFLAVNPECFTTLDGFHAMVEQLVDEINADSSMTAARSALPGARSWGTYDRRLKDGIALPEELVRTLDELARDLRIPLLP
jgi:LDH2 family malate/lactate/ureidoglycolate dehydrogenase